MGLLPVLFVKAHNKSLIGETRTLKSNRRICAASSHTSFLEGLELVSDHAKTDGKRVLFILDEADALLYDQKLSDSILSTLPNVDHLLLYTVNSKSWRPSEISEHVSDIRAKYQKQRDVVLEIAPDSKTDVQAKVLASFRNTGIQITQDGLDAIYEISQGWPRQVEVLLFAIQGSLNKKIDEHDLSDRTIDRSFIIDAAKYARTLAEHQLYFKIPEAK